MKKICFIVPSLGGGGAERVAFHLLNKLPLEQFEISVIIIYKEKGDYLKELRKEVECIYLNKSQIRYALLSLYQKINELKPDIVLVFSFDLSIIIGVFLIPIFKNICFINRQVNMLSKIRFSVIKKILLKIAYKNFDKIITQSKDMTKDLLKNINISKEKIVEINNPVDVEKIEKLSNEKMKLEMLQKNKNLLCVGRLEKQKGFDLIIKVMKLFSNKNIKLYILGDGKEKIQLEKLIEKYGLSDTVFLLGRKINPYIYMKNADLFILSSRYEGFPNVLIEAGACGLYSICNNCLGGVNEIIKENVNGNILDFKNDILVEKIIRENLNKKKDVEKVKRSIFERYNLEIIIKKYIEIFNMETKV